MPGKLKFCSDSPTLCNGAALRKATRRISQLYDAALAPCGLKLSQHSILVNIERAGDPPTMGDLAKILVLDRTALAHNIKPLERDGLIEQIVDDHDKRSRRVRLTTLGEEKLVESKKLWVLAQDQFEAAYGVEKAKDLRAALSVISSANFWDRFEDDLDKS